MRGLLDAPCTPDNRRAWDCDIIPFDEVLTHPTTVWRPEKKIDGGRVQPEPAMTTAWAWAAASLDEICVQHAPVAPFYPCSMCLCRSRLVQQSLEGL